MTASCAGVDHGSGCREKLPVVARGVEGQFEDAEVVCVEDLAVRLPACCLNGWGESLSTGSDDKLPDASLRIGFAGRVHRRKSLVVVVVAVDDDFRVVFVERFPEWSVDIMASVLT